MATTIRPPQPAPAAAERAVAITPPTRRSRRRLLPLLGLFLQLVFGKAAAAIGALETLLSRVENQIAAARRTFERNDLAHPSSLSL